MLQALCRNFMCFQTCQDDLGRWLPIELALVYFPNSYIQNTSQTLQMLPSNFSSPFRSLFLCLAAPPVCEVLPTSQPAVSLDCHCWTVMLMGRALCLKSPVPSRLPAGGGCCWSQWWHAPAAGVFSPPSRTLICLRGCSCPGVGAVFGETPLPWSTVRGVFQRLGVFRWSLKTFFPSVRR